jgi:hypothetical protein
MPVCLLSLLLLNDRRATRPTEGIVGFDEFVATHTMRRERWCRRSVYLVSFQEKHAERRSGTKHEPCMPTLKLRVSEMPVSRALNISELRNALHD